MQSARYHRLRGILFLVVGIGSAGLVFLIWAFGALDSLERNSLDTRFSIRGTRTPPAQIVFVAIDDVTTDALPNRVWPYPRRLHARVLDRIAADHPKAIAVDIQFTEQTTPQDDNALFDAVKAAKMVVLATTETLPNGATRIFGGNDVVRQARARPGSGLFPTDSAGVIRKVRYSINGLKTLAVVTVERATGRHVGPALFGKNGAWIDFAGTAETFPTYSYSRVLFGRTPKGTFKDKIVVVGPSAPSLQDIHQTPTDSLMPGGEVQANAISTVLRGLPLRSAPRALAIALILLLGFLTPALSLGTRPRISMPVALLAAAAFAVAVQLSFNHGRIVLFVYPLAALVLSTVGALGVHTVLTAFEREQVRNVFARFVPETVVKDVLARTDADLRLGGVQVDGTVLFTDLRGFTSASEHLPAARVIEMINRHLEEITETVLAHGGTLVNYTGDGIMAVFGAPIEQEDHAERAFAAGCAMITECLPRWNEWLRSTGLHEGFKMGVGLNSGPFMSGNIGSAQRLAYTAMGDTINTGARIEAMTKGTPYMLLLADSTRERLSEEAAAKLVYLDEVEVRGRTSRLKLWGLLPVTDDEALGEKFLGPQQLLP
jgi:adenylate cyclase